MPPKKGEQPKKAKKPAVDSTFGMKNKKGAKGQKAVQQVQQSREAAGKQSARQGMTPAEKMAEEAKKAKAAAAAAAEELRALQRASIKQKPLEPGVDPKSVVCEFFKAGCCEKGAKCKYAHDLTVSRKAAKIDLYSDRRAAGEEGAAGGNEMGDWDQGKLEAAVASKNEGGGAIARPTDIVCKFFLDAIEKELYGWFWVCPNDKAAAAAAAAGGPGGGGTAGLPCKYRHALPPGFVFKTRKEREAEAAAKLEGGEEEADIGEAIEDERRRLPTAGLTPVTAETFKAWKEKRDKRKAAEAEKRASEEGRKGGAAGGGGEGGRFKIMSGRALFAYNPDLFVDDDDADDKEYSDDGGESETGDGEGGEGEGEGGEGGEGDEGGEGEGAGGEEGEEGGGGGDGEEDGEEEEEEGEEEEEEEEDVGASLAGAGAGPPRASVPPSPPSAKGALPAASPPPVPR